MKRKNEPNEPNIMKSKNQKFGLKYLDSSICFKLEGFCLSIFQVHLKNVGHAEQRASLQNQKIQPLIRIQHITYGSCILYNTMSFHKTTNKENS